MPNNQLSEIHYHVFRNLEKPRKLQSAVSFVTDKEHVLYTKLSYEKAFDFGMKPIFETRTSLLKIGMSADKEWALVIGKYDRVSYPDSDNRLVGWIKL